MALNSFVKTIHCYISPTNGFVYIKGMCYAEKTKHKVYCVCLLVDQTGVIIQCNCLCPAGSGFAAACKHVSAILYGIEHYALTGKSLECSSCTSKLQTWHVPTCKKSSNILFLNDFFPQGNISSIDVNNQTDKLVNNFMNRKILSPLTAKRNANMRGIFWGSRLYI